MSAGNVVRAVLKIAVIAVLARLLTPVDFGLVAAAGIVIWLGNLLASLGAGPALLQRRELEPAHIATGFTISLLLGVLLAVLLYVFAPAVAALLRLPELPPVLRALAPMFPIAAVSVVAESLLLRELRFGKVSAIEVGSYAVGYGMVGVAMAVAGAGVWALVGAELAKGVMKSALFLYSVPHTLGIALARRPFRELMVFGSGYTLGGLTTYLAAQGDGFVVARFLGAAALGLYSRAYDLMLAPANALGTVLDKILLPTMSRVQDDAARLRLAYRRSTALVALLVLPLAASTVVLAPEIVRTLLGPRWEGAVVPLRILTVVMYFRVGYMVGYAVANSVGAVYRTALRGAGFAMLVVAGAAVGQRWGLAGVAAGVGVAVTANFIAALQLGTKITGLTWGSVVVLHLPALFAAAVVAAAAALIAFPLREADIPAPTILLAAAFVLTPLMALLLRTFPRAMLGDDGIWMVDTLWRSAPPVVQPWLRRLLVRAPTA